MKRTVVVPCYNEARRLDTDAVVALADAGDGDAGDARDGVLFVDDGSEDDTLTLLRAAAARDPEHVSVLALAQNVGKGEAVRRGLARALDDGADVVGYLDADLSTPVQEMRRILDVLTARSDIDVVLGSRVALLGRAVHRSAARHYLGRVFATVASTTLGLPVYDTQCGAKAFRAGVPLRAALGSHFDSRWAFDVELLGRLLDVGVPRTAFFELPLDSWRDVSGSKLSAPAMLKAGLDVVGIGLRRRR